MLTNLTGVEDDIDEPGLTRGYGHPIVFCRCTVLRNGDVIASSDRLYAKRPV